MIKKIGIFGASGLIGYNFFKYFKKQNIDVIGTFFKNSKDDLIFFNILEDSFDIFYNCDVVIIAGAISKLDDCKNQEEIARKINVTKTIELINYCKANKIKPVFLSSDQVFDGKKGNYSESDLPNPVNNYGKMKTEVENYIKHNLTEYLILRLSKTYSKNKEDGGIYNEIVNKLQKNETIYAATDLVFNPTDVNFATKSILKLITKNIYGLFHLAEHKIMNRYDFTIQVAEQLDFKTTSIKPILLSEIDLSEKRALNSSLNVNWLQTTLNNTIGG